MNAAREILTARQIAERAGVSERMIRYAMKVQARGIPAVSLAVEAGTLPMVRAATIAGLPEVEQADALAAAVRGENKPKRPNIAQRTADAEAWRIRAGLLALRIEQLTGEPAPHVLDRVIARHPARPTDDADQLQP